MIGYFFKSQKGPQLLRAHPLECSTLRCNVSGLKNVIPAPIAPNPIAAPTITTAVGVVPNINAVATTTEATARPATIALHAFG